jgi:hypothetical protein
LPQGCSEPFYRRPSANFRNAQGLRQRRRYQFRIADPGKADDRGAVSEVVGEICRDLQGESSLTDAAGPGQCQQRDIFAQEQIAHLGDFPAATDKRRARKGQV